MQEVIGPQDAVVAGAVMKPGLLVEIPAPFMLYEASCFGPDEQDREDYLRLMAMARAARDNFLYEKADELEREAKAAVRQKWTETFRNLVTTEGKNDIIDKYFKGSSYTAAWYLGLKGTGSAANGDTLASHGGWSEVTPYAGNRPAITWGTTSSGSNTASAVSISITGTSTVAGAFVASVNTGTSGKLYSAGDFAAPRSVANGDTLNVTPTVSVS